MQLLALQALLCRTPEHLVELLDECVRIEQLCGHMHVYCMSYCPYHLASLLILMNLHVDLLSSTAALRARIAVLLQVLTCMADGCSGHASSVALPTS